MQALKRFLHLSKQERLLVFQAVFAMYLIRLSLALFSLRTVHRLAVKITWRCNESLSADRIVWAVRSAARFVPESTCLVQALAAHSLLIRHGYNPLLTIGVAKNENNRLGAHAWVTCNDEVLIGGHEAANYTALLNLES
jgi:Transglutaminase-like superfamily